MLPMTAPSTNGVIPNAPVLDSLGQLAIIDQQIRGWLGEEYGAVLSRRVHLKLGTEGEVIKNLSMRVDQCRQALAELTALREEHVRDLPPPVPPIPTLDDHGRLAVLDSQIAVWQSEQYAAQVSHRVYSKLMTETDTVKKLIARMEQCERAIDELHEQRGELAAAIEQHAPHDDH